MTSLERPSSNTDQDETFTRLQDRGHKEEAGLRRLMLAGNAGGLAVTLTLTAAFVGQSGCLGQEACRPIPISVLAMLLVFLVGLFCSWMVAEVTVLLVWSHLFSRTSNRVMAEMMEEKRAQDPNLAALEAAGLEAVRKQVSESLEIAKRKVVRSGRLFWFLKDTIRWQLAFQKLSGVCLLLGTGYGLWILASLTDF